MPRIASLIEPEAVINVLCQKPGSIGIEMLSLKSLELFYTYFAETWEYVPGNAFHVKPESGHRIFCWQPASLCLVLIM